MSLSNASQILQRSFCQPFSRQMATEKLTLLIAPELAEAR
jgi:hypothetical protein